MNRDFCYFLGLFGFIDSIFWFIDFLYLGKTLWDLSLGSCPSVGMTRGNGHLHIVQIREMFLIGYTKKWDPVKYWNFTGISIFALKSFCEFFRSTYLHPAVTLYKKRDWIKNRFFWEGFGAAQLEWKKKNWHSSTGCLLLASTTRCWRTGIYFLVRLHRPIAIGYFYIDAINIIASRVVGRYEKKRKEIDMISSRNILAIYDRTLCKYKQTKKKGIWRVFFLSIPAIHSQEVLENDRHLRVRASLPPQKSFPTGNNSAQVVRHFELNNRREKKARMR